MKAKGRGQSYLLLLEVVEVLSRRNIPYAVIGAFAVSFYGYLRASLDADLVISSTVGDGALKDLTDAFVAAGLQVEHRRGDAEDPIRNVIQVTDAYANQVDILQGIGRMDEKAFERVWITSFENQPLAMISPEDLLAMKLYAGSPKDLADVKALLRPLKDRLDLSLLGRLVRQFGNPAHKRFLSLFRAGREGWSD